MNWRWQHFHIAVLAILVTLLTIAIGRVAGAWGLTNEARAVVTALMISVSVSYILIVIIDLLAPRAQRIWRDEQMRRMPEYALPAVPAFSARIRRSHAHYGAWIVEWESDDPEFDLPPPQVLSSEDMKKWREWAHNEIELKIPSQPRIAACERHDRMVLCTQHRQGR